MDASAGPDGDHRHEAQFGLAETVLQEHENDVEGIAEVAAKARKLGAANPLVSLRGAVSAAMFYIAGRQCTANTSDVFEYR